MPACIVPTPGEIRLYYSGWNRRVTIPYHNTTGVAISVDGGMSFRRKFEGPVLDRTPHDPFMAVTPWVVRTGDQWRMWYVAGRGWLRKGGALEPIYGIKYATSVDGIAWNRLSDFVIPFRHEEEAIARPTVLFADGAYHMWYCFRDSDDFRDGPGSYRIGYAYSRDGVTWKRADHLSGLARSPDGWDSTMQCYPYVVETKIGFLLFYSGNGFGRTGVGCAIWEGGFPTL